MKVLIATDGSEFSKAAVKKACDHFLGANDQIRIVSAYDDSPIAAEPYGMLVEYQAAATDAVRKQAADAIKEAESIVRDHPKGKDAYLETMVLTGRADREIVADAEKWGADMIVVGSHGRGFWDRALLGSVSTGVLHHAPCSVLIARSTLA